MEADTELKVEQAKWKPWEVLVAAVTASAVVFGTTGALVGYLLALTHR